MSQGYPYRTVRPLYPEIADSVCDCALLPDDYCVGVEELVHTVEISHAFEEVELVDGEHQSYRRALRHCPVCAQHWWLYSQNRTDFTYARDDETRVVGSVSYSSSRAVRCADTAAAAELDGWLPEYLQAVAHRDRLYRKSAGRLGATLKSAVERCIEMAERSAQTRMLGETSARASKLAEEIIRRHQPTMTRWIAVLEADPADRKAWIRLAGCQRDCAAARLQDPARELADWTLEESWTPALAGVRKLEFDLHALRQAARGAPLGSPAHRALRAAEDSLAERWMRHFDGVEWAHPEAAFMSLLTHAQSLEPLVVAGDMASWTHPDRIGKRLREVLQSGAVRPTRHIEAVTWLAARTGLPDARERYQARAAANYWLSVRRSKRGAAAGRAGA